MKAKIKANGNCHIILQTEAEKKFFASLMGQCPNDPVKTEIDGTEWSAAGIVLNKASETDAFSRAFSFEIEYTRK